MANQRSSFIIVDQFVGMWYEKKIFRGLDYENVLLEIDYLFILPFPKGK